MAEEVPRQPPKDPILHLARNVFCEPPPDRLTVEQLCALHAFFHEVLAAGYRLYQIVPIDKATPVIRQKFSAMVQTPNNPLHHLAVNVFCEPPPDLLTVEQLCALHEFFHEVLAAGYRLYQIVPIDEAIPVIRKKFSGMAIAP